MQAEIGAPLSDGMVARRRSTSRRPLVLWMAVALLSYAADQVSKAWAEQSLTVGAPRSIAGDWLRLDLTRNAGAAFSIGTGYTVVLTLVAVAVIVGCLRAANRLASTGWAFALGLLLGGAAGNLTDRLFRAPGPLRGHVVDFLRIPHWPVFNVADSCICAAAALVVVLSLRGVRLDGSRVESGGPATEADGPAR